MDFDKVGSISWTLGSDGAWTTTDHSGVQGDTIEMVEVHDFEDLLAAYKATRRALENQAYMGGGGSATGPESAQEQVERWLSEARTELAQEAMQGRAE